MGGGVVPAYIQATDSQIINNVATTQGGGINAATCDGVVLYNTEVSGNFGETFPLGHGRPLLNLAVICALVYISQVCPRIKEISVDSNVVFHSTLLERSCMSAAQSQAPYGHDSCIYRQAPCC